MRQFHGIDANALGEQRQVGAVLLRPLEPADRPEWDRLWSAYLEFYRTSLPKAQFDLTFARYLDPAEPMNAFLAIEGGRPRGLVHVIFHHSGWMEGPTCYLQDLFVDHDARGTHLGRALIEHVYHVVKSAGGQRVYWLTHESNEVARRLYDRLADNPGFIQYVRKL